MTDSISKESLDAINSPLPDVDDDTSSSIGLPDAPAPPSNSTQENLSHSVWSEGPAKLSSAEKPAAMAEDDWLKKLDGVSAPDYDGEWEDSPSRAPALMQDKLLEEPAVADPVAIKANTTYSRPVPTVASNLHVVASTPKVPEEKLANQWEDIDLNSPGKKPVQKPNKKSSVSVVANKGNIIKGSTAAAGGKRPTNACQSLAPKTSNIPGSYSQKLIDGKFELLTLVGVSPMPTFTQVKAQADSNLDRGYVPPLKPAKSPTDSNENLIGGEYADVSMDMLDHEMGNAGSKDYPTYHFPGTYDAAKQDTYEAVKNVSSAASSFGSALGVAGVGKTFWSVGSLVGSGARRTGKVVATTATIGAIKLGYKEQIPANLAQWAEETSIDEARKAEKKKPVYKLAGAQYKKGDPRNYVLAENSSAAQQKSINLIDDLDEDDWTTVNVEEGAEQPSEQACKYTLADAHLQNEPRESIYGSFMTAVESTAVVAKHLGRNFWAAARTVRGKQADYLEQKKRAAAWPKNLAELEYVNRIERKQTIPRLNNPHFTKVLDIGTGKVQYTPPNVTDPDDDKNNFDNMAFSDEDPMD
ncbi:hypothetical protein PMIN02_008048 [Paraphaeosphaeria minitans]